MSETIKPVEERIALAIGQVICANATTAFEYDKINLLFQQLQQQFAATQDALSAAKQLNEQYLRQIEQLAKQLEDARAQVTAANETAAKATKQLYDSQRGLLPRIEHASIEADPNQLSFNGA